MAPLVYPEVEMHEHIKAMLERERQHLADLADRTAASIKWHREQAALAEQYLTEIDEKKRAVDALLFAEVVDL